MSFDCPVCGYPELPRVAQDDLICPCCGTHFGYHDYGSSYEDLRLEWIRKGAPWFSKSILRPDRWDAVKQLSAARMLLGSGSDPTTADTNETNLAPNDMRAWSLAAAA